jgi:hypothetical protein
MKKKFPRFYGGTVDQATGQLYDERDPQRPQRKRDAAKERERAKAARQARKKNRRRGVR